MTGSAGNTGGSVGVAVALRDGALRRALREALAAAGCQVAELDTAPPTSAPALLVTDAPEAHEALLSQAPVSVLQLAFPGRGRGAPRDPRATAYLRLERGDELDDVVRLARHLVDQHHRWRGAWISTDLLRAVRRRSPRTRRDSDSGRPC